MRVIVIGGGPAGLFLSRSRATGGSSRRRAYALDHDLPWPDPYSTLEGYTPRFEWGY